MILFFYSSDDYFDAIHSEELIESIDSGEDGDEDVNDAMSEIMTVPFSNDVSSQSIYAPKTTPFYQFMMPKPLLEFVDSPSTSPQPQTPQSSTTSTVENEPEKCLSMMQMFQIILKQQLIINESADGNILTVRMTRYDFNQYLDYLKNKDD